MTPYKNYTPFHIGTNEIQQSGGSLLNRDIGKWCIKLPGCYQLYPTQGEAMIAHEQIRRYNANNEVI